MKETRARLLVVDDDPAMLRAVERILAPAHDVVSCLSGEAALEAFREDGFNVAIVDIRMPGMDGFELTRAIKKLKPQTEVILVTGSVSDLDDKLVRSVKERAGFFPDPGVARFGVHGFLWMGRVRWPATNRP